MFFEICPNQSHRPLGSVNRMRVSAGVRLEVAGKFEKSFRKGFAAVANP